jgi:protein SCO1/2
VAGNEVATSLTVCSDTVKDSLVSVAKLGDGSVTDRDPLHTPSAFELSRQKLVMKASNSHSRTEYRQCTIRRLAVSPFLRFVTLGIVFLARLPQLVNGQNQTTLPEPVRSVGIDQRLNEQLPLDLEFRNEEGRLVRLAEYFGSKPVVLSLVYHECPMLCSEVLNGLLSSLRVLKFDVGKEFNVLTVSFNPKEDSNLAKSVKESYLKRYKRAGAEAGWHFLTGDQTSIDRLTKAVGFRYTYDAKKNLYAHLGGIMVLTPQGRLSKYFYGIEFAPKDLRLGLVEASQNSVGSVVDQILLFCYHYDPAIGKYGFAIMTVVRLSGVAFVLSLGTFLVVMFRREARG